MRMQRISPTQLRVDISAKDLESYGFTISPISYNTDGFQNLIDDIIKRAHIELGFDVKGPFALQLVGTHGYGATIILTIPEEYEEDDEDFDFDIDEDWDDFDEDDEDIEEDEEVKHDSESELVTVLKPCDHCGGYECASVNSEGHRHASVVFRFDDFEHLISVAKILNNHGYFGGSVYHKDKSYFFITPKLVTGSKHFKDVISVLSEYGLPSGVSRDYLEEYGKVIFKDGAILEINQMFLR